MESQSAAASEESIAEAIGSILEAEFGKTPARAIAYHVDPHLAVAGPEVYADTIRSIFGAGAEHLLGTIVTGLGERFGIEAGGGTTLGEMVRALQRQWSVRGAFRPESGHHRP